MVHNVNRLRTAHGAVQIDMQGKINILTIRDQEISKANHIMEEAP